MGHLSATSGMARLLYHILAFRYGSRYGSRSVYGSRSGFEGALPSPPFRVSSRSAASGPHMALYPLFVSSCLFTFVSNDLFPFFPQMANIVMGLGRTRPHRAGSHRTRALTGPRREAREPLGATRACPDPLRSPVAHQWSVNEAHDMCINHYSTSGSAAP